MVVGTPTGVTMVNRATGVRTVQKSRGRNSLKKSRTRLMFLLVDRIILEAPMCDSQDGLRVITPWHSPECKVSPICLVVLALRCAVRAAVRQ